MVPNAVKVVHILGHSHLAGGMQNSAALLEKRKAVFYKIKHVLTLLYCRAFLPKEMKAMLTQKPVRGCSTQFYSQ